MGRRKKQKKSRSGNLPGLNPDVLIWARESAGLSVGDVASSMGKPVAVVEAWESGASAPTYPQLERLAYTVLKRPTALFFFPEPPDEADPSASFRTLPDSEAEKLAADTRYRIRSARAQQLALMEMTRGRSTSERSVLRDVGRNGSLGTAKKVREYLGVTYRVQTEEWRSATEALDEWREAVESSGVFVFKNTFKQREVSGFSLFDSQFPLIVINNSTAVTRQIFTLFHELGHLLAEVSGVTKADDSFIEGLPSAQRKIEVWCNKFAADLLLPPSAEFKTLLSKVSEKVVSDLAGSLKVSREVVLRRALDLQIVTQAYYERMASKWNREYEEACAEASESGSGGGNYYYTQGSYISRRYAELAFSEFYRGRLGAEQLADYLDVRVKSLPRLEEVFLGKATR